LADSTIWLLWRQLQINLGMQVSLLRVDSHSFRYMPKSSMAGSEGKCTFSFWGTTIMISIVITLVYIPTNSVWGFLSPTSLPAFVVCFLHDCQSDWGDSYFLYG
jgi:hypothetical protein